jgi:hypothetical protein
MTPAVRTFLRQHQPQVCVVPAGGARFDLGGEIIMGADEVIEFATIAQGMVVANHLEAISHCPVTRAHLRAAGEKAGLGARLMVPADGETLRFGAVSAAAA